MNRITLNFEPATRNPTTSIHYESPLGIKRILGFWLGYNNGTSTRFRIFFQPVRKLKNVNSQITKNLQYSFSFLLSTQVSLSRFGGMTSSLLFLPAGQSYYFSKYFCHNSRAGWNRAFMLNISCKTCRAKSRRLTSI